MHVDQPWRRWTALQRGFAGGPCIAAFAAAQTAMPSAPVLALPLTHPGLASRIATAAHRLGYLIC